MLLSSYETHHFPNPLIPFIYHPHYHLVRSEVETNWHKNIELLYCFTGSGYVRCGASVFDFVPGDIVAVSADQLHTIGTDGELSYCCLIIGSSFCAENGLPVENLSFQNVINDPELTALMQTIPLLRERAGAGEICAVADYRYAVLGILRKLCSGHCAPTADAPVGSSGEYTKKAITYIRKHMAEKMSLDSIAVQVGISKFHLAREFKAMTGNTIIGFINTLRCWEAKRLIENGSGVSVAAYACGFDNLSYFSKTFQKLLGAPPSSFAKHR